MSDPSTPDSRASFPSVNCQNADGPRCFYQDLCDNLFDGVYLVDTERKITYWNHGAERLTGFQREEAIGRHCYDNLLMHLGGDGCSLCHGGCPLAAALADGKHREAELSLQHKLGHRIPVSVRVSPLKDDLGAVVGAVEIFSDLSTQKALERRTSELESIAYQDALTGLSNRRHIELRVQQALEEVEQFGRKAGLLLLDIDCFKVVNDKFGHSSGDVVLKAVAETLLHSLRPGDNVGRWGGEEFLFVAMDVTLEDLKTIGERCRNLVAAASIHIDDARIQVTVSVGAALLINGESAAAALKRADELLYMGKCQGGNKVFARR